MVAFPDGGGPRRVLGHAVEHAAHLLPGQRPIEAFVHHNTLHAFEEMSFEQAVCEAGRRLGAKAWMEEAAFRAAWDRSRILARDLNEALERRVPETPLGVGLPGLTEREAVRRLMLGQPRDTGGAALSWRLIETDVLEKLPANLPRDAAERWALKGDIPDALERLWSRCAAEAAQPQPDPRLHRPRDKALAETGHDPDRRVHPVLIRWCAAYLDMGQAYWPMPDKDRGFYRAMLGVLSRGGVPLRGWMRPLRKKARDLLERGVDATDCALEALGRMGVEDGDLAAVVEETLLALPGWPGMFVQLAARPDLSPRTPPPTDLADFLAIRLLLDEAALAVRTRGEGADRPADDRAGTTAWRLFHAALLVGLHPDDLVDGPAPLRALERLLGRWSRTAREGLWQLAYERRTRVQTLDGILAHHARTRRQKPPRPIAQVITCIDDREESLRRHLEELDPAYETLGAAGFYGVAMAWRPLGEPHPQPLCPAGIVPRHLVEERPDDRHGRAWARVRRRRSWFGRLTEAASTGTRTLFRGSLLSVTGLAALVPMALRILAPSLHAAWTRWEHPVPGRMTLELDPKEPEKDGYQLGYRPEEMVAIVRRILEDMGLVRDFAPLVVLLGHGSSSMNNPHEAAHDCGACGGGRGGPNARAFAAMANRPDVRAALAEVGVTIPEQTWFVGGYHNTANDAVDWYDLDLVPDHLADRLTRVRADLEEARRRDAHERCRRFESAPLDLSPAEALRHVEDRSEDLAQPRPEYGHATNALCFVGRRRWSRGLFLDRRVFLTSYDPAIDPDSAILERLLAMVGPVGAGINLEYYFSFVDPDRYGCNTKLPHNITSLLGVMDGHASDLRTGLPWQMVEIHEPVRLLNVIEATPAQLAGILERQPALRQLVVHRWILVVAFDPTTDKMWFFDEQGFVEHVPESETLPEAESSVAWYGGSRDFLPPATIRAGAPGEEAA